MIWQEIAEKEGCIYCQVKDTWCAFTNMRDGTCNLDECVNDLKEGDKYGNG